VFIDGSFQGVAMRHEGSLDNRIAERHTKLRATSAEELNGTIAYFGLEDSEMEGAADVRFRDQAIPESGEMSVARPVCAR